MSDEFDTYAQSAITPSEYPFEITPADGADLEAVTKAIYVGTAGDIVLRAKDRGTTSITFGNVPAGTQLQVRATRVLATGTTAGNLVGLA